MMGQPHAETGFIPDLGRKPVPRWPGAERKIRPVWASIRIGDGHGQRIAAFSITELLATWMASRGIRRAGRSGGAKPRKSGLEMMFRILSWILIPKITWAHSS